MSILDNIYKGASVVQSELKGMNAALKQMQVNDKKEYSLDAKDRKYQKEKDKREKQDQRKFHNQVFDAAGKQVKTIGKQEQGKKLASGIAKATGTAIKNAVKKKRGIKDKQTDLDSPGAGTGGPSFGVKDILMSTPMVPSAPIPKGDDDHEERLIKLEQSVFADKTDKVFSKYQSGGFTGAVPNLGQPGTGDHFYTHVEPGSYVLNRNAVQAMGFQGGGNVPVALEQGEIVIPPGQYDQKMMDFINYAAAPRFQSGGVVQKSHPDTGEGYSVGPDAYGRPSVLSKGAAEALQKMIDESKGAVKTSDIVSAKRSPEKNKAVGGVANSNHLTGNAMDIHGASKAWIKEHGHKYGWHNLNYSGHDGHFDYKGAAGLAVTTEGGKADPDVKESETERTASPEAAQEAGVEETVGGGGDLGTLGSIGGGLFAPFFEALNQSVFGGGDNKFGIGLGHIMGGVGVGQIAKIGMESMKAAAGPAVQAAEKTIPQITGSKGSGDRSTPTGRATQASVKDPNAKALLDAIARAEGTTKSYGTVFGGKVNADLAAGKLTVKQSIALGDQNARRTGSGATGRYQFMPQTLEGLVRNGTLKMNEKFTPAVQDRAALALVAGRGVNLKDGLSQKEIQALSWEWASIKGNNYTFKGKAQGYVDQSKFMNWYTKGGGKKQGRVKGGTVYKQGGGLVSLKKAAMSDDMSKFFVQTDNQLMEQAISEVAPQIINVGGEEEDNTPAVTMHNSGSNLPTYDLPTRDSCPLSIYYRYHPSLNPQGMNP